MRAKCFKERISDRMMHYCRGGDEECRSHLGPPMTSPTFSEEFHGFTLRTCKQCGKMFARLEETDGSGRSTVSEIWESGEIAAIQVPAIGGCLGPR